MEHWNFFYSGVWANKCILVHPWASIFANLEYFSFPGCQEIADEFRSQEIDGQALMLLKEDHLMSTMNIKLGPALKIFARISMLKDS